MYRQRLSPTVAKFSWAALGRRQERVTVEALAEGHGH
jgi:hypothetical protein